MVDPHPRFRDQVLAIAAECGAAGEHHFQDTRTEMERDFPAYVEALLAHARGENLPAGLVTYSMLWLVRNDTDVLGRATLRHYLTPDLEDEGGHIGYMIRPSARRRGYGTVILGLALERAHGLGLARVLVTCDDDNLASARIIEKNGGTLASASLSPTAGRVVRRYWIVTPPR